MSWAHANGVRFHIQRLEPPAATSTGKSGPVVVFVHGLVMDNLSSFYYTLAPSVVGVGGTAFLYDLRGHGRSGRPETGYAPDDAVCDLLAVLDAEGVHERVYLVGNSYGGLVAARVAVRAPHRVAGLVILEAECAGDGAAAWQEDMTNSLTVAALGLRRNDVRGQLAVLGQRKVARLAAGADALLNGTTLIDDLATAGPLSPAELAQIECPVLAVYGERSELIGGAEQLRTHVPDASIVVLPGMAHTVLREATGQLRELVLSWLDEHQ